MTLRTLLLPAACCLTAIGSGQPASTTAPLDRTEGIYELYEARLIARTESLFHDGRFEECLTILRIQHGMRPEDADVHSQLVWMLGNLGRRDEAASETIVYRRRYPTSPVACEDEAKLYLLAKQFRRIPPVLEPVIESSTALANFVMLARAYEELGLYRSALRVWELRAAKIGDMQNITLNIERLKKKLAGG